MEHDGSAISVFDKHPNEGHPDENIISVVILWGKKAHEKVISLHFNVCVCL